MKKNKKIVSMEYNDEENDMESFSFVKSIVIGIATFIAILTILCSITFVNEKEQAVVTRFGKAVRTEDAGINFKIPFVERFKKVNTTTQGLQIGYRTVNDDNGLSLAKLMGRDVNEGETVIIPDESMMITSDFNFINIDFYLEYKVTDPIRYLYSSSVPEDILKNISQACIRTVVSNYSVDDVMTTGKNKIQSDVKSMIITELEKTDIGIQLVNASIQDAEPPEETIKAAFNEVESERQNKETSVNNAKKYASENIPAAEAKADAITQKAEASKQSRINEANGQVARFAEMFKEYEKSPLITKQRIFYETMENILPNIDIIITDGNTENVLPLESFVTETDTENTSESKEEK